MSEREYKEKVKIDGNKTKVERETKDEFGNKIKEKHENRSKRASIFFLKKRSHISKDCLSMV